MKANKKGVSLAFVIVVVLALVILSSLLFTAAAHSMSMTGRSTEGRAAYLKAKSAIEYGKTEVYDLAKSNTLDTHVGFSIGPSGDYFEQIAAQAPNGTTCLAQCAPAADGKTWKITAKVKYTGLEQYQQMSYSFTLEGHKGAPVCLPASDFLAAGVSYGKQNVFDNNNYWAQFFSSNSAPSGTSAYPVVENLPVHSNISGGYVKSHEIFFMGSAMVDGTLTSIYCYNNTSCSVYSDDIVIANNIGSQYEAHSPTSLKLFPEQSTASTGIVYFAGGTNGSCSVSHASTVMIPAGYYRFDAGIDLLNLSYAENNGFRDSQMHSLTKLTEVEQNEDSMKPFQQDWTFVKACYANKAGEIVYGGPAGQLGANFEYQGVFGAHDKANNATLGENQQGSWNVSPTSHLEQKTVCAYASIVGWPSEAIWPQYTDAYGETLLWSPPYYNIYCAKQFFLRFVSSTNQFTLPASYNIVFHSDLVALSVSKTDTDVGTDADHRPKIVQASNAPSSQFLLTSLSKDGSGNYKNVTLAVQNDIKVVYSGESYIIPSGVYSVPSGFNFFDTKLKTKEDWAGFWSGCREGDYSPSGSGSGSGSGSPGTPGSFTITPGQYSVS